MSEKDVDLNEGVQIILNRMKTNPEEFFDGGGRWQWIFKETLREVLTEIEKAALFEGLKQVRRMEITAKAAATVLRADEQEERVEVMRMSSSGSVGIGTQRSSFTFHTANPNPTIQLGQEQLSAEDVREMKKMIAPKQSLKDLL